MPSTVKCQSCGFEFPSRGVSFGDRQSFEDSSIFNNITEELCPSVTRKQLSVISQGIFGETKHSKS
jgi:hypothetical protein